MHFAQFFQVPPEMCMCAQNQFYACVRGNLPVSPIAPVLILQCLYIFGRKYVRENTRSPSQKLTLKSVNKQTGKSSLTSTKRLQSLAHIEQHKRSLAYQQNIPGPMEITFQCTNKYSEQDFRLNIQALV